MLRRAVVSAMRPLAALPARPASAGALAVARRALSASAPSSAAAVTRFTKEHEYARLEGGVATCGITDFAQAALGDVVYVSLPEVGATVKKGCVCERRTWWGAVAVRSWSVLAKLACNVVVGWVQGGTLAGRGPAQLRGDVCSRETPALIGDDTARVIVSAVSCAAGAAAGSHSLTSCRPAFTNGARWR
jgi:hypothetical protein